MTRKTATPLTDAAAIGFARLLVDKETFTVTELVPAEFARSLELVNIALVKALDIQHLRPALLVQLGYVPECVLDVCNKARDALAKVNT